MTRDLHQLPPNLPAPADDGACDHLPGAQVPSVRLQSTAGRWVDLAEIAARPAVFFVYPRTGEPGRAAGPEWDAIPGARGCTPQSCGFRDHFAELGALGVAQLYGLSTQTPDDQREVAQRLHLPFTLLSDAQLELQRALNLPTFAVDGMTLLKRLTLVLDDGTITKVFYPVFPPDKSAAEVIAWLRAAG
jgi:peroxiredoxin